MVRMSVAAAVCTTLFVSLILPIIIYIVYGVKNRGKGIWTAWLLGAAGFFVMQIIIRLPILNFVQGSGPVQINSTGQYALYTLVMAFTAGLAEVIGRYAVAKILSKKLTFQKGFAAGLGHGGIESIIIVGITYLNNLIYVIMINTGSFDKMLQQTAALGVDTRSLEITKSVFVNASPLFFYTAGYERIVTMIFHVALSLLVCYFVWKKKDIMGVLICLGLHTLTDFATPMLDYLCVQHFRLAEAVSALIVYAFLTIVAVLSIIYILRLRNKWKRKEEEVLPDLENFQTM